MFVNFYFDVRLIENEITSELSMIFYHAQVSTVKVVCLVSGGCMFLTAVVMLLFYIKHYIDTHKKELGILKALGYSNQKIAKSFWVFGISTFIGTAVGYAGAFLIMPRFYALQNEDKLLPEIAINFHPSILFYFVLLPTVCFSALSVCYAWYKLKKPVLLLLKDHLQTAAKTPHHRIEKNRELLFVEDLKRNTLKSKKALVFFIIFASFCFSAMTQMSFSMKDLSSEMMGGDDAGHRTCISVYNSVSCHNYSNKRKYKNDCYDEGIRLFAERMLQGDFRRIQTDVLYRFCNWNRISVWVAEAHGGYCI